MREIFGLIRLFLRGWLADLAQTFSRQFALRVAVRAAAKSLLVFFAFLTLLVAWYSKDLPTPGRIRKKVAGSSLKILDRGGKIIFAVHGDQTRLPLKSEDIPRLVRDATIAAEDKNFYRHFGLDFRGIARAAIVNTFSRGRRIQGGSTITQQYVKNALLTPRRTFARKVKEAILAIELEILYSKDEILASYLNEVPYGSTAYGIEAASRIYFGKSAKELTLAEAALLAALPRAPTYYSPYGTHTKELFARQHWILERMAELGLASREDVERAKEAKLTFAKRRESILAPHFAFWVRQLLVDRFGERFVDESGLEVTTTIDLEVQAKAEEAIRKHAARNEKVAAKNAALVAIDPKTGQILAMVGSRDFFDEKIDGNVNVALARRQPGSAIKPVIYAQAFEDGYYPAFILWDLPTNFGSAEQPYEPQNYDGQFRGPMTVREALANSVNVPAVKMLGLLGVAKGTKAAQRFGLSTLTDPNRYGLSLVLGGGEVRLLDLASAYAVLANRGEKLDLAPILRVRDWRGRTLEEWKPPRVTKRIVSAETAFEISHILADNEARARIFGNRSALFIPNRTVAAKTGTSDDFRDAWTFGYTPSLVAGVWVGNNDNAPMRRGPGAMVAAPIWHDFMVAALEGKPNEAFERPASLQELEVDALTGKLPVEGWETRRDLFAPWQIPKERASAGSCVKLDKISGKLATELTPAEMVEERCFRLVHSERPADPAWEGPVRRWAEEHGFLTSIPTERDDVHTPANMPRLAITSPQAGAKLSGLFEIVVDASAPKGLRTIEFAIDGIVIANKVELPYSVSYNAANLAAGQHTIRVTLFDLIGFKVSDEVKIIVEPDKRPPTITNITVQKSGTSATITWSTDEPATSQVFWGTSSGYLPNATVEDRTLKQNHQVTLSGLSPGTAYFYRVSSRDSAGNTAQSEERSFIQ